MRVVGGRVKGRNLAPPASRDHRPPPHPVRASVFALSAGTGALGIEAISRGAAFALLVDNGAEARALMRNNVEALGLGGVTKVYRRDATSLGPAHPVEPVSLGVPAPPHLI